MSRAVAVSRRARNDLRNIAYYLEEEAGLRTSLRFLRMANVSFKKLVRFPKIGSQWETEYAGMKDVRTWPILKFPNYIIFCRPSDREVEVLRVLHGAMDLPTAFEG